MHILREETATCSQCKTNEKRNVVGIIHLTNLLNLTAKMKREKG